MLQPTHFDPYENLLMCVSGTKRLWLFPPADAPSLYPIPGRADASRSAAPPFKRHAELPSAMRDAYPRLAGARPLEVRLAAGDLLYLPACWWHCVEGSRERNMILNWWFRLHADKVALG